MEEEIEKVYQEIIQLIKELPERYKNDQELGKAVRSMVGQLKLIDVKFEPKK